MILHDMIKFELNIRAEDYISSLISILEDRVFEFEDDDDRESSSTLSGKARLIMNRFIKTGWIDKEFMDNSFIEIITPRNYAIPVLRLLSELGNDARQEYNSLVYATFSGLKLALNENEQYLFEALMSAKSNTEQLQYSLRTLYHGIREFMRGIAPQQNVNYLLQDHFNEYKKMTDQIYHPIKTMDSVHRYMAPIQGLLADILSSEELLASIRDRAISIKKYDDESQTENEIIKAIDYVMDFFRTVGGLVSEIDRKHSVYTKSSVEKIQYLMTSDQTIKGKLAEMLTLYAKMQEKKRDELATIMDKHINAERQSFFDTRSLYHKSIKNRRIDRAALAVSENSDIENIAKEYLVKQIADGYPIKRIRSFIDNLFQDGRNEIESKDIHISCDSDFIMLILAVIRQGEIGLPYVADIGEDRVECNGYIFPQMVIRKGKVNVHVE
jgi:hypothetical protein